MGKRIILSFLILISISLISNASHAVSFQLGGNVYTLGRGIGGVYAHSNEGISYDADTDILEDKYSQKAAGTFEGAIGGYEMENAKWEIKAKINEDGILLDGNTKITGSIPELNLTNQTLLEGELVDFDFGPPGTILWENALGGFAFIANVSPHFILDNPDYTDWAYISLPKGSYYDYNDKSQWFVESWECTTCYLSGSHLSGILPTVTEDNNFSTTLTLQDYINFDYKWDMTKDPPPYEQGYMFDVLALQGGDGWQYIGQTGAYNTSTGWETAKLVVPESLQGLTTQIRFVLDDYNPDTDPIVYLKNINSPVPEPSTLILISTGLIGLAGWGRKKLKKI